MVTGVQTCALPISRALGGSKHRHSCFRSERCNLANAKKKFYAFMCYIVVLDMQISNMSKRSTEYSDQSDLC
jgi:hypothetical protein